jgi:hypothetical protein
VSIFEAICIFLAGIAAGTINTVVGSGTLVTFPTLLAFGYPPVVATMSNAVGLVPGNISGTWGYRRELSGQWDRLRWQLPGSLLGALTGAWLLLHLPETTFKKVVPVLLVFALILVIAHPGSRPGPGDEPKKPATLTITSPAPGWCCWSSVPI